jgi:hypothetical protein
LKPQQLRVFCPVILYHNGQDPVEGHERNYNDNYNGKDSQQVLKAKKRAQETMTEGSQYWRRIYENLQGRRGKRAWDTQRARVKKTVHQKDRVPTLRLRGARFVFLFSTFSLPIADMFSTRSHF